MSHSVLGRKNLKIKMEKEKKKVKMDLPQHIFVLRKDTFRCCSKESKILEWFVLQFYISIRPHRILDDSGKYDIRYPTLSKQRNKIYNRFKVRIRKYE